MNNTTRAVATLPAMLERVALQRLEQCGFHRLQRDQTRIRAACTTSGAHCTSSHDLTAATGCLLGEGEPTGTKDSSRRNPQTPSTQPDMAHLEFLYPFNVVEFLRSHGRPVAQPNRRRVFSVRHNPRYYSSSTRISTLDRPATSHNEEPPSNPTASNGDTRVLVRQAARDIPEHIGPTPQRPSNSIESSTPGVYRSNRHISLPNMKPAPTRGLGPPNRHILPPKGRPDLEKFMHAQIPGKYDAAWGLYVGRKPLELSIELTRRHWVARYLLKSSSTVEWNKVAALYERLPIEQWTRDDYMSAVRAHVYLGQPEKALDILRENVKRKETSDGAGFESFIRYYIMRNNWELVTKAWRILRGAEGKDTVNRKDGSARFIDEILVLSLEDRTQWSKCVDAILDFADSVPPRELFQTAEVPIEDDLAEALVKGCLGFVTRPHSPWTGDLWRVLWNYIRKRCAWLMPKSFWDRTLGYLAGHKQDAAATYRYHRYLKHDPTRIPLEVMNKLLSCYARLEDFAGMGHCWDDIFTRSDAKRPDEVSYEILMTALARRGDAPQIEGLMSKYLEEFPQKPPNAKFYSHIMQAYAERGELDKVKTWFNDMTTKYKVKPDVVNYNILINACRKSFDIDEATLRVKEMLEAGVEPDYRTYVIILKMCADRGDVEGAESILKIIQNKRPDYVDPYVYESMVAAHVNADNIDAADAVLQEVMEKEFEDPPTAVWNTVLSGHAARGNDTRVNELLELMVQKEIPFNYLTYGIVMHSLCQAERMEEAENTLSYLYESKAHIGSDKYAILMVGYTRLKEYRRVWETFETMMNAGIPADWTTLAILLKSYAHSEAEAYLESESEEEFRMESTEAMLEKILNEDRGPDFKSFDANKTAMPSWLFTPIINVYASQRAWDRSIAIFNRFLQISAQHGVGGKPNLMMLKSMMLVYLRAGDADGVRGMWYGYKSASYKLHKEVLGTDAEGNRQVLPQYRHGVCRGFSIFIKAMGLVKDIASIKDEMEELKKLGYELDNVNWNDYAQALVLSDKIVEAAAVCEKHLMSRWREIRPYMLYQDITMRMNMEVEGKTELPAVRPYIRTIESLATELRALDKARQNGDPVAKQILIDIYRNSPVTWEACDGLEDMENRASKELMYRLQRQEEMEGGSQRSNLPDF